MEKMASEPGDKLLRHLTSGKERESAVPDGGKKKYNSKAF